MVVSKEKLWETGRDETVEVNQRALIDKVLARYSGEFTVFRELLQNSDDAQSEAVEIRFETEAYLASKSKEQPSENREAVLGLDEPLPDLGTTHVHQWTFKNNGIVFRDEDWTRLKKIAEGNPDEEKIGAFGVGFYSLFSVTEEPFVTSGDRWMGFYWKDKKDQLFARRGELSESDQDPASKSWTSFAMMLREPAPIPVPFDLTRFLASSLTFMRYLRQVSIYFDDKRLVKLNKTVGLPRNLTIPKGLSNRSPTGIMTIDAIQTTPLRIQAQVMRWVYTSGSEKKKIVSPKVNKPSKGLIHSLFFSRPGASASTPAPLPPPNPIDNLTINETSVSLSIYSASVKVRLDKKLSDEINRSTKKNPPTNTKFELIYTAKDEYDASVEEDSKQAEATGSIFQGLRADVDGIGSARVFIGHSTAQSTGVGGHIAARFIPTVERESIDFMDRNVAVWNKELLYVGGFLSRATYEVELSAVHKQWEEASSGLTPPDKEIQARLVDRGVHVLKFFMFYPSTPSSEVSSLLESAFFSCPTDDRFPVVTTKGVQDMKNVRLPDPIFAGFLKNLPTLPDEIMAGAPSIVTTLQARGLIKAIDFEDVLKELQSRCLAEDELVACMNWWINIFKESERSRLLPMQADVLKFASFLVGQKVIPLASIKSFINPQSACGSIPFEGPLPESLLPVSISKLFKPEVLSSCFPWTELSLVEWLSFICNSSKASAKYDISSSPIWSERVLGVITRAWPNLPAKSKAEIIQILATKTCIPTSAGLKLPNKAYFPSVNIFKDLPIVTFQSGSVIKGIPEKFLHELGVRKHLEVQLIFDRMIKTNEWTIADLTKYLVSVVDSLTAEEMAQLRATAAFPAESINGNANARYKASQLYQPLNVLRALGLPVIDWGRNTKWRGTSEEAKFLFDLGLQRHPPLEKLVHLCTDKDMTIRASAFKYLIDNLDTRYKDYNPMDFNDVRFLPAKKGTEFCLGNIQEVFSAPWTVMGFMVLQPAYQAYSNKLQIKEHPPASQLIDLLQTKPPKSHTEAVQLFRLLSGRVNDFKNSDLQKLSNLAFVPVRAEKGTSSMRLLPPSQCFLAGEADTSFHSKLFVFVDFGAGANSFLTACGTRSQPSVEEVAKMLLNHPQHFYELAQGPANFLEELRNLAINIKSISSNTKSRMKNSPILLGFQRKPIKHSKSMDNWDESDEEWDVIYELKKPKEIIVVDDMHAYQAFGDALFTAPPEDIIEEFYMSLGSLRLSSIVKEESQTSGELNGSKSASETRSLILERLPLFLHEYTHSKPKVSFSWLLANHNFVVRAFGKLAVVKSLRHNNSNLSCKQDASAMARRNGSGPIELWIAGNVQVDMYEVATALNRLIFDSPKANDALLLMTILSTDLRSLKRRGYNVDRILRQQKEARLVTESARPAAKERDTHLPLPLSPMPFAQVFQNLRRKISSIAFASPTEKSLTKAHRWGTKSGIHFPAVGQNSGSSKPTWETWDGDVSNGHGSVVIPLSNITKNIDLAINSCRSESADFLQSRVHMRRIKESMDDGYCDISGRKDDLHKIGESLGVKIYLSAEVTTPPESFLETKSHSITRFIHIIKPLATIYELPITNLHIFYDDLGGPIAFNRNGSIFLSLRYFEQWHLQGEEQEAYISWYFTIAHEIAHNLVHPHNSEHEFYFSATCQRFIRQLAKLIDSPSLSGN